MKRAEMGIQDNMELLEDYSDSLIGEYEVQPLENGESYSETVLPKFKTPRIYGIRDFPDGCGPNAAPIDAIEASGSTIPKRFSHQADLKEKHTEDFVHDTESHSPKVAQGLDQTELLKTEIRMPSNDDKTRVLVNMVDGKNGAFAENEMSLGRKLGSIELNVDLGNVGLASPVHLEVEVSSRYDSKTALTRKYPPRRNISAIRDFPAFCGRDARRPTKEEYTSMGLGHLHETMLAKDVETTNSEKHEEKNTSKYCGNKHSTDAKSRDSVKAAFRGDAYHLNSKSQLDGKKPGIGDRAEARVQNEPIGYGEKVGTSHGKIMNDKALHNNQKYSTGFFGNNIDTDHLRRKSHARKSLPMQKATYCKSKSGLRDANDFEEEDEEREDLQVVQRSDDFKVNVAPLVRRSSTWQGSNIYSIGDRNKVRETLRYFQVVFRKLLQEDEAAAKKGQPGLKRVDLAAAKIVKGKGKHVNIGESILGSVPGVEVGDEFRYRVELAMVGLHRQSQAGIDYVRKGTKIFATSVVASGAYANDLCGPDVLIYMGAGGNIATGYKKALKPEDQKLERGNLAMKNSADSKKPVRVIRGFKDTKTSVFTYDGLYMVDEYWQEQGPHGKLVFQFKLVRMPGQPELAWNEVKKCKKNKVRDYTCVDDISLKREVFPVCAINDIDKELPPKFKYISSIIKPKWYNPAPPRGCGCKDGCVDSDECSCATKNGSVIPYNHNGCIVEVKQLVYECGPACKCPKSCYNRVSQHGLKFPLEIFKTKSKGWGVRSLDSIPSGSFICEYLGELLSDKEAELKIDNDEYLFDIGQNYKDLNLHDGLGDDFEDDSENFGFTIDAEKYGNVGRFINHSCSPNLYAQSVLYDHDDKRMPHIMFFAAENIPPLKELTYHYNYKIDQVHDSDGNVKKRSCHCGSSEVRWPHVLMFVFLRFLVMKDRLSFLGSMHKVLKLKAPSIIYIKHT